MLEEQEQAVAEFGDLAVTVAVAAQEQRAVQVLHPQIIEGRLASCGKRRSIEWAERMVEDVLPDVAYAPLVFTIPKILRRAFLFDPSLYSNLCRAAYCVVREAFEARFAHLDRPVPGFLASCSLLQVC